MNYSTGLLHYPDVALCYFATYFCPCNTYFMLSTLLPPSVSLFAPSSPFLLSFSLDLFHVPLFFFVVLIHHSVPRISPNISLIYLHRHPSHLSP